MVQNYANSLEETNDDLRDELKQALFEKHRATSLTVNAKQLTSNRLDKWHIERDRRRAAENEVARLNKSAMEMDLIIKGYRSEIEQSGKSTRRLKKEWANEEAAVAHGGARRWPPWVVQVICELLVNGTSPSAVPTAMQTMYQMLTGDTPNELPTINFVRSCRVVVEVIGETIAAMKLADAPSWNQLWTDGTTRRQIPFTALVIGLMGEDDDIDPVVVSSCIFMEDERSDTQADGIINRTSCGWTAISAPNIGTRGSTSVSSASFASTPTFFFNRSSAQTTGRRAASSSLEDSRTSSSTTKRIVA